MYLMHCSRGVAKLVNVLISNCLCVLFLNISLENDNYHDISYSQSRVEGSHSSSILEKRSLVWGKKGTSRPKHLSLEQNFDQTLFRERWDLNQWISTNFIKWAVLKYWIDNTGNTKNHFRYTKLSWTLNRIKDYLKEWLFFLFLPTFRC